MLLTVYDQGVPPRRSNTTLTILINYPGSGGITSEGSGSGRAIVADRNLVIVIAIACVTGVIVVILLVGIVAVLRRRHHGSGTGGNYNYKARMADQRVLVGGGSINSTDDNGSKRGSVNKPCVTVDSGNHEGVNGAEKLDLWSYEKPYEQHNDSFLIQVGA